MNLKTTVNRYKVLNNETAITLGQDENTFTLFYKVDTDAAVDGTTLEYDLYIKHTSSDFKTLIENDTGTPFVTTELVPITAGVATSQTGYTTINVDNGYTLLDGVTYVVVLNTDSTVGSLTLDMWTQASGI